jgi:hypothetical protein
MADVRRRTGRPPRPPANPLYGAVIPKIDSHWKADPASDSFMKRDYAQPWNQDMTGFMRKGQGTSKSARRTPAKAPRPPFVSTPTRVGGPAGLGRHLQCRSGNPQRAESEHSQLRRRPRAVLPTSPPAVARAQLPVPRPKARRWPGPLWMTGRVYSTGSATRRTSPCSTRPRSGPRPSWTGRSALGRARGPRTGASRRDRSELGRIVLT